MFIIPRIYLLYSFQFCTNTYIREYKLNKYIHYTN